MRNPVDSFTIGAVKRITSLVLGLMSLSAFVSPQGAGAPPRPAAAAPKTVSVPVAPRPTTAAPKAVSAPVAPRPTTAAPKAVSAPVAPRPTTAAPKAVSVPVAPRPATAAPKAVSAPVAPRPAAAAPKTAGAPETAQFFFKPSEKLLGLEVTSKISSIKEKTNSVVVSLTGRFQRTDWSLLFRDTSITPQASDGSFSIDVTLHGQRTPVLFQAISPFGQVEKAEGEIVFSGWEKIAKKWKPGPTWGGSLSAGLGVSLIAFTQSNVEPLNMKALTFKASYGYRFKNSRLDFGMSSFLTALPLTTSDVTIRFFGFNGRVGYAIPGINAPWRVSLMAGAYYTTTFADSLIGYQHVGGPMFFPVVQRAFAKGAAFAGYFKFSPISDGMQFLDMSSREIAGGISWSEPVGRNRLSFSLDISDLKITSIVQDSRGIISPLAVTNRTVTAGLAWGW